VWARCKQEQQHNGSLGLKSTATIKTKQAQLAICA